MQKEGQFHLGQSEASKTNRQGEKSRQIRCISTHDHLYVAKRFRGQEIGLGGGGGVARGQGWGQASLRPLLCIFILYLARATMENGVKTGHELQSREMRHAQNYYES